MPRKRREGTPEDGRLKENRSRKEYQKAWLAANREKSRAYSLKYRSRNLEKQQASSREWAAARREEKRQFLAPIFAKGCTDCGNTDPEVLEFDHVKGEKAGEIGQMFVGPKLLAELEKCVVRCANCHKKATAKRRREGTNPIGRRPDSVCFLQPPNPEPEEQATFEW